MATRKTQAGFTMIEFMIVLGIISILAAIAIPRYRDRQIKAYETYIHTTLSTMSIQTLEYLASTDTMPLHLVDLGYSATDTADLGYGPRPVHYLRTGPANFYFFGFNVPDASCGVPPKCFAVIAAVFLNGDALTEEHAIYSVLVNANGHDPQISYAKFKLADL